MYSDPRQYTFYDNHIDNKSEQFFIDKLNLETSLTNYIQLPPDFDNKYSHRMRILCLRKIII